MDFDEDRLQILKEKEKTVNTICINIINYKTQKLFDLIIIPYSTLQFDNDVNKIDLIFKSLHSIMSKNTVLIFDVSESFNSKFDKKMELLFKDYSSEVNDDVEVYYTSKRHKDYIEFFIEYKLCNKSISVLEHEKYYYYDKKILSDLINENSLELVKIDDGYGNNEFKHKHLYHCKIKMK